jgi:cytochrome c oxidase cbb3-type subunit 3
MKHPVTIVAVLLALAPMAAMSESDLTQAKQTFDQMCAGCHGFQGDGKDGTKSGFVPRVPTLANKEYMASLPDDYLFLIIKKGGAYMGKIAAMPAWEQRFSDEEIRELVAHIRTFTN